jgi:hypothetical protein
VPGSQLLVPVTFVELGDASDAGAPERPEGYPIPPQAKTQPKWIEGGYPGNAEPGGDRHLLIVDRDNRTKVLNGSTTATGSSRRASPP